MNSRFFGEFFGKNESHGYYDFWLYNFLDGLEERIYVKWDLIIRCCPRRIVRA